GNASSLDHSYGYDASIAEWGYISIEDLLDNNATMNRDWKPCRFDEAQKKVGDYRRRLYGR
ncbi:MAG: hypothetical protein COY74_04735, partial [Nitrosopumilales archaeon CG_4_10_14_0_8_um_filter_34_8]